ncbi:hypothetical protein [Halorubrum sp. LN27]|uniref:hypothetical protein n=1 Tax=Halorubrum sp. LN27 TaxID=2801032 RepID=UPI00190E0A10|nr:hypothetical protein [Halorubrum sp. LN27]
MNRTRSVGLTLALFAAAGLAFGSLSAVDVTSDRGVDVGVAGANEDPYLGFEAVNRSAGGDGDAVVTVAYENRFGVPLDGIEIRVTRGAGEEPIATPEIGGPISAGGSATVDVTVDCGKSGGDALTFRADAAGPGVRASTTHTVEDACDAVG